MVALPGDDDDTLLFKVYCCANRVTSHAKVVRACGDLTLHRVAVLNILGPHVLSTDVLSHDRRVDLVSMRLYGADNGR